METKILVPHPVFLLKSLAINFKKLNSFQDIQNLRQENQSEFFEYSASLQVTRSR